MKIFKHGPCLVSKEEIKTALKHAILSLDAEAA